MERYLFLLFWWANVNNAFKAYQCDVSPDSIEKFNGLDVDTCNFDSEWDLGEQNIEVQVSFDNSLLKCNN